MYGAAQNNIGWLYRNGWGVGQDYAEAMRWYRKAADQGNADAQNIIGWLYRNGWGVGQDYADFSGYFGRSFWPSALQRSSWPPASARRCAFSNSSRPRSATRTRAGPMPRITAHIRERQHRDGWLVGERQCRGWAYWLPGRW
jgi:TPR repeat protein